MTGLLTAASLCSGYGGLDLAVHTVLDTRPLWLADNDPDAAKVLACRFPGVPNLGDLTAIDWTAVPPVDVLTAGFPCQDISYAGRGAGIKEGTRSGLWHTIADALDTLRPRLLVLENVRAIVARRPGLDVVLADLARLGFDANWTCLRASDIGAAHQRERWFCLAWPTADAASHGRQQGRPESARLGGRPDAALGGDAALADAARQRHGHSWTARKRGISTTAVPSAAAHTHREAVRQQPELHSRISDEAVADLTRLGWGPYAPAIARWEATLSHSAPWPIEPGRDRRPLLSPRFVEWLMGLSAGWVTDVPGISRNSQLRLFGNGVIPLQGATAIRALLPEHLLRVREQPAA